MKKLFVALSILLLAICPRVYALNLEKLKFSYLEGDYKAAISEGEKILAASNRQTLGLDELYYLLGLSYLKDGNLLRANDIFEIILKEFKESDFKEDAKLGFADSYFLKGDFASAKQEYNELLQDKPNTKLKAKVYSRLAQIGFKTGDTAQGKYYSEKLKQEFPANSEVVFEEEECALPNASSDSVYTVQVGSFASRVNAFNLTQKLTNLGYPAYIAEINSAGRVSYRVRVGKSSRRQEILALEKKLSLAGYPTKVCP